jgi:hypothetical protein
VLLAIAASGWFLSKNKEQTDLEGSEKEKESLKKIENQ